MSQPNLYNATDYANWQLVLKSAVTAVAMQAQLNQGYVTIKGRKVNPLAASQVLAIDLGTKNENVTVTSIVNPQAENGFPPTAFLATFTKAHSPKAVVATSTNGLQEAVIDAIAQGGGLVVIDNTWPGAAGSAVITALPVGSATVGIQDIRSGVPNVYAWGGSAYALTQQPGAVLWGGITGTLSNQTDLVTALAAAGVLQSATVTLTAAQIKAMATAIQLIAAPGAGKLIAIQTLVLQYKAGATPFTIPAGDTVYIGWGTTPENFNASDFLIHATGFLDQATSQVAVSPLAYANGTADPQSSAANQGIYIKNPNTNFTLGDGTLIATFYYSIVTLA